MTTNSSAQQGTEATSPDASSPTDPTTARFEEEEHLPSLAPIANEVAVGREVFIFARRPSSDALPSDWACDEAYGDSFTRGEDGYWTAFAACERDWPTALAAVLDLFSKVARDEGLPDWPITEVDGWEMFPG